MAKIEKVRSNPKSVTLATVLSATGGIVKTVTDVFGAPPLVGLIGTALNFGAEMLDPPPKLSDLRNQTKELQESIESSSGVIEKALKNELKNVEDKISLEMAQHAANIQSEVQRSFKKVSRQLDKLESTTTEVKVIVTQSFGELLDSRHRDGLTKLDSAYQNFLRGSHNLEDTFKYLSNFIFELETDAYTSLRPERIEHYLQALSTMKRPKVVDESFQYVLMVRGKYLLLVSAFYLFNNDLERVEKEFESFNEDFEELMKIHTNLNLADTQVEEEKSYPEETPEGGAQGIPLETKELPDLLQNKLKVKDQELEEFLKGLNLDHLYDKFVGEDYDFEILCMSSKDDLNDLGFLSRGQQFKIMKGISELNGNEIFIILKIIMDIA